MLRIVVLLVPGGRESAKRELARADLGNVSDLAPISDYLIQASEGWNPLSRTPAWQKRGLITEHSRAQSVWRLVERTANWCGNEEDNVGAGYDPR